MSELTFAATDLLHRDVVEQGGVQHGVVVRGESEADEQGFTQRIGGAADRFPRFTIGGNVAGEDIAGARELEPVRRFGGGTVGAGRGIVSQRARLEDRTALPRER